MPVEFPKFTLAIYIHIHLSQRWKPRPVFGGLRQHFELYLLILTLLIVSIVRFRETKARQIQIS
ncbi:hypothetical protein EYZ11_005662 [Aspergillus tanneri]|uniref:Uncharacterized protein n=1 Tax=Aspergillus tanneri TaxID=1220188 RepID=A0A4S3JNC9_9EURO|nr:hypothetical protein EYZ11_005662 [Aspergillus tanneri]